MPSSSLFRESIPRSPHAASRLYMRPVLIRSFALVLLATVSGATLVNITIDDANGDASTGLKPQYSPLSAWSQGSTCPRCHITQHADAAQAFEGTWHDSTYHPGQPPNIVQMTFNGSAVYVYNMVANVIQDGTTTFTNLTFSLDGTEVGHYMHVPQNDAASTILYRTVVYQNASLTPTSHVLSIEAGGTTASLVLFDYAIYTTERDATDVPSASGQLTSTTSGTQTAMPPFAPTTTSSVSVDGSQSSSSKSSAVAVGSAVGAAVGVVAALATLGIGVFVLRRRRSLALPLFSRKATNLHDPSRPSSFKGTKDDSPHSSPVSPLPSPLSPPSPMAPSLEISQGSPSFSRSDLVFAPIPTPSPRHSASRIPTPLATPPTHRADVPASAVSATETEHSIRLSDLTREIAELESYMRGLRRGEKGRKRPQGPRADAGDTSVEALRERMARLREELEAERRLLAEARPRERRPNPWSLKGRRLRVVNPEELSNA
ncbi:hypothetical protein L226DRAFT_518689 [Lentinus tigrinus ALCF2SS1-7]|uniref:Uncharacterized protein n=1 Tax=Lentinus tigrinus ALCF2SS1-6 TaxID=1328759 RepID=A0A5C2SM43_9APHY|nr:hypothetical protein L227DRAFT_598183 [Lentinus tigrinus ALCF2SS1-6]RPD82798.1 hypothetical protein L226DRAFT_518689 [Lentinus tigrinus ALCF2SS1-7]